MYSLKIGDKTISIQDGQTIRMEGIFQNPEITLIVEPHKVFSLDGIHFSYPKEFIYEADLEKAHIKTWTFSGNDFKIMCFAFDVPVQVNDFIESMLERYGRQNCVTTEATPLTFSQMVLAGTTINATIIGVKMAIDIYQIPSTGMSVKLLMLQDNVSSHGIRSTEGMYAIQLLEQSSRLDS